MAETGLLNKDVDVVRTTSAPRTTADSRPITSGIPVSGPGGNGSGGGPFSGNTTPPNETEVPGPGAPAPTPATDIATPGMTQPVGYEAQTGAVDQGKQTVQGQMESLLSKDSDYMKLFETRGLQQANSRGLLNTSMAVQASQAAAIEAALPIAQQDADINFRQSLENQAAQNQARSLTAQLSINQYDIDTQREIQRSELAMEQVKIDAQRWIEEGKIMANDREQFTTALNEMSRQNDVELTKIWTDSSIPPAQKNRLSMIQNSRYQANVTLMADLYGVDMEMTSISDITDYYHQRMLEHEQLEAQQQAELDERRDRSQSSTSTQYEG